MSKSKQWPTNHGDAPRNIGRFGIGHGITFVCKLLAIPGNGIAFAGLGGIAEPFFDLFAVGKQIIIFCLATRAHLFLLLLDYESSYSSYSLLQGTVKM